MPFGRAIALYLHMLREWADEDRLDEIERALTAPLSWRDPATGLPAGFDDDDGDEYDEFMSNLH